MQEENTPVALEGSAGCSARFSDRIRRSDIGRFRNQAGCTEGSGEVVALFVDFGIDFVSDAVVALIAFETDVVRTSSDPDWLAVNFERRFPDSKMMARGDDLNGFGTGVAVVLRAVKQEDSELSR